MALWYEQPSLVFPTAANPSSQLKTSHRCCQAGLLALSDAKSDAKFANLTLKFDATAHVGMSYSLALRSYKLEGTHIAVVRRFCF